MANPVIFNNPLNRDQDQCLTNGVWDTTVQQWMMKVQMHAYTSGGLWMPLTLDANNLLQISVKDSALPTGAALAVNQVVVQNYLSALETLLTTVSGNVGDLETLLALTNGYIDSIEGLIGAQAAAAVDDPTASGGIIPLLKGFLKHLRGDGATGKYAPVKVFERVDTIKTAPVTGAKTVSTTAAEIFAGASRLANRYMMAIYNEGTSPIYLGATGVGITSGFPLFPQDVKRLDFSPGVATPIYGIGPVSTSIRVEEYA